MPIWTRFEGGTSKGGERSEDQAILYLLTPSVDVPQGGNGMNRSSLDKLRVNSWQIDQLDSFPRQPINETAQTFRFLRSEEME